MSCLLPLALYEVIRWCSKHLLVKSFKSVSWAWSSQESHSLTVFQQTPDFLLSFLPVSKAFQLLEVKNM